MQLIAACDIVFTGYTKTLFKAAFALAWVCYLRTSEYTEARPGQPDHNLPGQNVIVEQQGVGVEYASDKTLYLNPDPKHRLFIWTKIPDECKAVLMEYD